MQIWYYSVCLRMLVCTDAWRLLLYFVDDLVAIGRGEAIDTMAYSADNGCRAVTAFPFQCTNAWLSFYMYISFFIPFELLYCFYYCLYLSEVTNKVVQSIKKSICPKLFVACKIHCKSRSRRPDGLTTLDWFTVHEANLSAYVRESAYVLSRVGCGRVHQTLLLHVPLIFQRRKSDANKQDFEI